MAKSVHFPSNSLPWRKAIIWKRIVIMRLKKMGQKYLSTISYMITIGSLICISLAPCSFISTHMNLPYSLNCMICHCINETIYQTTTDKYFNCIQFVFVCGFFFNIFYKQCCNKQSWTCNLVKFWKLLYKAGFLFQHWIKCTSGLLLKQILTMLVITSARLCQKNSKTLL